MQHNALRGAGIADDRLYSDTANGNDADALEWVMERYEPHTDKDSGIKNDPKKWNREHDYPTYILNLVKRVIRVRVETFKIVGCLPSIQ